MSKPTSAEKQPGLSGEQRLNIRQSQEAPIIDALIDRIKKTAG